MQADYAKAAVKELKGMTKEEKHRIRAAVQKIPAGDIRPLKGSPGSFRLRVGSRRVIFSYHERDRILVERIGPRGDVYKK